ncbi:macro domain-containing protein [Candidatus Bathyarchaeota archaeon]|nr:MAG: macro domain-containing protein [Candidatus Bathyarchaeota archaeon]
MTKIEHTYKNVKITVTTGDITKQKADAIVNPANSRLIMGGGAAGAIKRAGGKEIEDEAIKKAPVPVGKAIATGAGRLEAKYVIHAPTMKMPAMRIDAENVKLAMKGALECAEQLGIKSIVFPGMGTGVGGLQLEEAAVIMVKATKKHIDDGTCLKEIVFVGFRDELTNAFKKAVEEVFKETL